MDTIVTSENPELSSRLQFDEYLRTELSDAARWARFLAIMGFIFCGFIVAIGIFVDVIYKSIINQYTFSNNPMGFLHAFLPVIYIIIAGIYLFPFMYLYRFATKAKSGMDVNSQADIIASIAQLKKLFRFVGVILLIGLSIYAIVALAIVTGLLLF
jgi:hypothetical protein